MYTSSGSTKKLSKEAVRASLILKGHRSLRAWSSKSGFNYNTALAVLNGRRSKGPKAREIQDALSRMSRKGGHA